MRIVPELNRSLLQHPFSFDVHALIGIDQDVRNRGIGQEWLERAESEYLVENFLRQALPFLQVHRCRFTDDQRLEDVSYLTPNLFPVDLGQPIHIQFLDQLPMDRGFYCAEIRSRNSRSNWWHRVLPLRWK